MNRMASSVAITRGAEHCAHAPVGTQVTASKPCPPPRFGGGLDRRGYSRERWNILEVSRIFGFVATVAALGGAGCEPRPVPPGPPPAFAYGATMTPWAAAPYGNPQGSVYPSYAMPGAPAVAQAAPTPTCACEGCRCGGTAQDPYAGPPVPSDPITLVDLNYLRASAASVLAELVAALPPAAQAKVNNVPLVSDASVGEVNTYAACDPQHMPLMGITDGLLQIEAYTAALRATDELFGTQKLDTYLTSLAANQKPGAPIVAPPPGPH